MLYVVQYYFRSFLKNIYLHKIFLVSQFTLYSNLCFLKLFTKHIHPSSMQMCSYYTLLHFFFQFSLLEKEVFLVRKFFIFSFLLIISAVSVSKLPLIQAKVSSVKITITLEIMEATLSLRFFDFLSTMIIILWLKSHITYGYKHLLLSLFRYL